MDFLHTDKVMVLRYCFILSISIQKFLGEENHETKDFFMLDTVLLMRACMKSPDAERQLLSKLMFPKKMYTFFC
ncbi:MAG TPA: hypothetical protein DCK95_07910 [Anaerolineaceae bacterium]|nr:hypothetical protein [Anaerolineaceae bacterium]